MTSQLAAVTIDANDTVRVGRFWAGFLGWDTADDPAHGVALLPSDDTGFRVRFVSTEDQKTRQNSMHMDLTSASPEDQEHTVAKALSLGARTSTSASVLRNVRDGRSGWQRVLPDDLP
ncbi:VOC family protein [Nakamurella sp. GG22]